MRDNTKEDRTAKQLYRMCHSEFPSGLTSWATMQDCSDRIYPVAVPNPSDAALEHYAFYEDNDRVIFFLIVVENVMCGTVLHMTQDLLQRWGITIDEVYRVARNNITLLGGDTVPTVDDVLMIGSNLIDLSMEVATASEKYTA